MLRLAYPYKCQVVFGAMPFILIFSTLYRLEILKLMLLLQSECVDHLLMLYKIWLEEMSSHCMVQLQIIQNLLRFYIMNYVNKHSICLKFLLLFQLSFPFVDKVKRNQELMYKKRKKRKRERERGN